MESGTVHKTISAFKSGIIDKLNSWDNMLRSKEDNIKKLKEEEESCKVRKEDLENKIKEIHESLSELELQKLAKLEAEGVSQKLSDLNSQIKSLKSLQGTNTTPFPECPVCFEACNPSQGRLVCCCPEGHIICGQCADKVDKCPTCRRTKSSFGGTFTRVRLFERKASSGEDDLTIFERISELVFQKMPFEEKKKQVEKEFNDRKGPFEKELSEAKTKLEAVEKDIVRIKEDPQMAEKDLATLAEMLDSGISQMAYLANNLDFWGNPKFLFTSPNCFCALSCPHPLLIQADGRIWSEPCGCLQAGPCLCTTHQITLDLAIEGGSSGSVTIDLAARTNPKAVSRLFRMATENFYAGLTVDQVFKNDFIGMGIFDVNGKKINFTSFTPEEKKLDANEKHLLHKVNKFEVGILESEECGYQRILIYTKNRNAESRFRTVGVVTKGTEIIEEINNLPVENRKFGTKFLLNHPIKIAAIKKSSGRIGTHSIKF